MRFEQAKTILNHMRDFHSTIAEYYHELSEHTEKERVKMLLKYLEEHEIHIVDVLADYTDYLPPSVSETWFNFSPCTAKLGELKSMIALEIPKVDDIIEFALRLDNCIIETYREIVNSAESDKVKELFENLLKLEEAERTRVVINTARLNEL